MKNGVRFPIAGPQHRTTEPVTFPAPAAEWVCFDDLVTQLGDPSFVRF
jgi:hypothetical protein